MAESWRNRIVGTGVEDADQLLANPRNWRIHPKHQQAALEGILKEVGWVQNVIVNRTTGFVLDGHARVALAISRGEKVPVVYVELSLEEETLIMVTLDPLSSMAETDSEILKTLTAELSVTDTGLQELLDNLIIARSSPEDLWVGMPDYEQSTILSKNVVLVRFLTMEDRYKFGEIIGQEITDSTRSIYFPYLPQESTTHQRYVSNESAVPGICDQQGTLGIPAHK